ncbi:hypothetical protein BC827DRAFT_954334 [Russula dissimulans]|nr:hypothetical protein BC827DRAFT_954334 [Russula dissimulans]
MSRDIPLSEDDLWSLAWSNSNVLGNHVRRENNEDVGRAIATVSGFSTPTPTPSFTPSTLPPPRSSPVTHQSSAVPQPPPPPPPQRRQRRPPPPPRPPKTTSGPQNIVHGSRSGNARRARDENPSVSSPIGPGLGQTAANGAQRAPQPQAPPPTSSYPAYPSSHGVPGRRPRNPPGTLKPWRIGGQP